MDDEGFIWEEVWKIVIDICVYINYIVFLEVLERWFVLFLEKFFFRYF